MAGQEGAEEDAENINNDDINGEPIETEEKQEQEQKEGARKTSKYMTKYERARILGTRALQIRFFFYHKTVCPVFGFFGLGLCDNKFSFLADQYECSCDGWVGGGDRPTWGMTLHVPCRMVFLFPFLVVCVCRPCFYSQDTSHAHSIHGSNDQPCFCCGHVHFMHV